VGKGDPDSEHQARVIYTGMLIISMSAMGQKQTLDVISMSALGIGDISRL
jgi:hypothetical protein